MKHRHRMLWLAALCLAPFTPAFALDTLNIASAQRGGWDVSVAELGQNAGFFKKQGLDLNILYTQGSGETLQAVLSGSVDIAVTVGTHSVFGAFAKGAPIRIIGNQFTGANDLYYYVRSDSPIKRIKEASGRTIGISSNGSSSNMIAMSVAKHYGIDPKLTPTGNYQTTLTQVMTGQIDVGFATAPYAMDAMEDHRTRMIARANEVPGLADQTVRVIAANLRVNETRRDLVERYVRAYAESVHWLFTSPDAIKAYVTYSGVPEALVLKAKAEFQREASMEPYHFTGIDAVNADAVAFKFISAPLTSAQIATLVQIPNR